MFRLCILSISWGVLYSHSLSTFNPPVANYSGTTPTAARRSKQPQKTTSPCVDCAARQSRGRVARGVTCAPAGERGKERKKEVDVSSYTKANLRTLDARRKKTKRAALDTPLAHAVPFLRARAYIARAACAGRKRKKKKNGPLAVSGRAGCSHTTRAKTQ